MGVGVCWHPTTGAFRGDRVLRFFNSLRVMLMALVGAGLCVEQSRDAVEIKPSAAQKLRTREPLSNPRAANATLKRFARASLANWSLALRDAYSFCTRRHALAVLAAVCVIMKIASCLMALSGVVQRGEQRLRSCGHFFSSNLGKSRETSRPVCTTPLGAA